MKKYLVFLLSVLLVLGSVSFVIADDAGMDSVRAMSPGAKVQIGGDARVRGIWFHNADFDDSGDDNDSRYMDQRIRLKFKGEAGNGISANLRLYISNSPKWDGTENTNCTGCILVDYAYITIPIPVIDATLMAGLQKMNWGNKLYLWDDRYDVIQTQRMFGDIKLTTFTRKIDDSSVVGGSAPQVADPITGVVGDDNLKDLNDYGISLVANINDIEAGALLIYRADTRDEPDPNPMNTGLDRFDISLYAKAAMAGFNIGGELAFITGDRKIELSPEDNTPMGFILDAETTVGAFGLRADVAWLSNGFVANDNYVPTLMIGTDQNTALVNLAAADDESTILVAGTVNTDVMDNINLLARFAWLTGTGGAADNGDDVDAFEIDGQVSIQLAKNARYVIEGGIIIPGNDWFTGTSDDSASVIANRAELWF